MYGLVLHVNHLLSDVSYEMSNLIFLLNLERYVKNCTITVVMTGLLYVN